MSELNKSKYCVDTDSLKLCIDQDEQNVDKLLNILTNEEWLQYPCQLYEVESDGELVVSLETTSLVNGQIQVELILTNKNTHPVQVTPSFPVLRGVSPGGKPEELSYCFPQLIPAISNEVCSIRRSYSSLFPLQFMNIFHKSAGSLTLMTQDLANNNKEFWLEKKENRTIDWGVSYDTRGLLPNESWQLPPAVLDAHSGDWHCGLEAYRQWLKTWYKPSSPRKDWFLDVFNFRQHFLHENLGDRTWDYDTKEFRIYEHVQDDIEVFGGVDYVQIFDWSSDPIHGRVGEYMPTDVGTQYQDGSFTYAKSIINLARFAIPDFKLFVIVRCDEPMGNDLASMRKIFFNGEGIWLAGPLSKPEWFPQEIRDLIKKTYGVLHEYRDAFASLQPKPLVDTLNPEILANKFPGKNRIVWTIYNTADNDIGGELLKIKYRPGSRYIDVWNKCALIPRIKNGEVFLSFEVHSQDISCIVEELG